MARIIPAGDADSEKQTIKKPDFSGFFQIANIIMMFA
jgi:hypothetical protein